jgi:NAD+ kinase
MVANPDKNPISRVLVVWKITFQMEIEEGNDEKLKDLLAAGDKSMARASKSHNEHLATIRKVKESLGQRGIGYHSVRRDRLDVNPDEFDLIVAVGGDGTLLDKVSSTVPVISVNSARSSSFGHYALADIDTFDEVLGTIIQGEREPIELTRLELTLDGERLPVLVLNEVLIAHSNPAATSRYCIHLKDGSERQMSSGLLVGTPTGSTGWLRSAGSDLLGTGGTMVLPVTSPQYAYFVREPFIRPGEKLAMRCGFVDSETELRVVSLMLDGRLYIDGSYLHFDFPRMRDLVIKPSDKPLRAFVEPGVNDRYLKN